MVITEASGEFPQLEMDRLTLRKMTLDDVEFYFRHFNNEKVVEGSCFPGPKTLEAAKEQLELYCIRPFMENKGIRWGIDRIVLDDRTLDAYRSQGYMTLKQSYSVLMAKSLSKSTTFKQMYGSKFYLSSVDLF